MAARRRYTPWSATNGLLFGVIAGVVLGLAEVVMALAAGDSPMRPVRMSAGMVLGPRVFGEGFPMGTMVLVGVGLHLAVSALVGVFYSFLDAMLPVDGRGRWEFQAAVGMLFGIAVWLVDFQFIARGYYPWFLDVPQFPQIVLHAVFLGLPLALLFTAAERRRALMDVAESASSSP
ncbi:hypothetical protein HUA74_22240 [Myxococcus sp. CA051A]|uniref:Uncharacterized protein n=1 Tax=Myxococcus llanfairpwllgwyngyllgogerychwyrndrobwllllantysiliogogogochensis TaxID=2590453 RepID=A0A540X3N6_9BACT|nr:MULTISPECIES: hypothetical protein [Myxococcus]NTX10594.1 hypothetical protein [Myxococcus sp. CA056]NTX38228.1 hypothetical protein [Myxococcus sp. CA033]NTX52809.1 hypothetical protein [Myxococcus sp. CA039A]NTX63377.1 hypothetical protein [Myxococcus sp. CA051A]TQF15843.1 hypothetical protein FJV41_11355 [Myxococcus llanfairpwllgwyngyllgogerychwyrndrobwllllantysiliogogogochensis]